MARKPLAISQRQLDCNIFQQQPGILMDKKIKKKSHVLRQRIQSLQQQLAGARKQMDDKDELKSLEQQLAAAEAEMAKIKEE
jgi:hypothetical protein